MLYKMVILAVLLIQGGHLGVYNVDHIDGKKVYYKDAGVVRMVENPHPNCETTWGSHVITIDNEYAGIIKCTDLWACAEKAAKGEMK